eukprot:6556279-Prymnesium_polylepis.1
MALPDRRASETARVWPEGAVPHTPPELVGGSRRRGGGGPHQQHDARRDLDLGHVVVGQRVEQLVVGHLPDAVGLVLRRVREHLRVDVVELHKPRPLERLALEERKARVGLAAPDVPAANAGATRPRIRDTAAAPRRVADGGEGCLGCRRPRARPHARAAAAPQLVGAVHGDGDEAVVGLVEEEAADHLVRRRVQERQPLVAAEGGAHARQREREDNVARRHNLHNFRAPAQKGQLQVGRVRIVRIVLRLQPEVAEAFSRALSLEVDVGAARQLTLCQLRRGTNREGERWSSESAACRGEVWVTAGRTRCAKAIPVDRPVACQQKDQPVEGRLIGSGTWPPSSDTRTSRGSSN